MDRAYQGLVAALNRKESNRKIRNSLIDELAAIFEVHRADVLRPVKSSEYGVKMIPRYRKANEDVSPDTN
jgi:hypothetical protein